MKKYLFICVSVILTGAAIFLLLPQTSPFREKPICIAVAGPMSGDQASDGQDMVRGIQLYLDMVNQKGGVDGRPLTLKIFDDNNDPKAAAEIASEISEDKDILLVLGHKYSSASLAAGRVYRKNGIPAITASATVDTLTADNEWYFRIIPTNSFQGAFIANYVFSTLKQKTACIVFNKDAYGTSLVENFEKTAKELGLAIKKKWDFDAEKEDADNQLKRIADELKSVDDPGIIFVAAYAEHGARLISSLKYGGMKCSFIGPDSFYGPAFINEFKKNPQEMASPGLYSDNVYVACPFLPDIANADSYRFHNEFEKTYHESPTWYAAGYYDAAKVAIEALKKSDLQGKGHIRKDRREIRNALANIYNPDAAVQGVTGDIYFDKNRNVRRPMAMGIYNKQMLFPAFLQYQLSLAIKDPEAALEKVLNEQAIIVDQSIMDKTSVVYTGTDFNEISSLDTKTSSYVVDFYLWFRYEGEFDAANIRFMNAVDPIILGHPIAEEKTDNYTVKTYHVKAKFKNDFDFRRHPFDHQYLAVRFRHNTLTRDKLIYVKDTLGMSESAKKKDASFNIGSGWYPGDKYAYQDIITHISTLGIPGFFNNPNMISYSQFNTELKIRRNSTDAILRNIFPEIIMLICLYLVYFIPYRNFRLRVEIMMAVLISCAFYHIRLLSDLFSVKYSTFSEYVFFTVYGLIGLSAVFSIQIGYFDLRGAEIKTKQVVLIGKIAYPCMIAAFGIAMSYIFF
jgi:branched-chain amino acid transport system substrate-binding protein